MPVTPSPVAATGVTGLDDILAGGLPRDRIYLVQGDPGVGKTTLAMQFLLEGVRHGEVVLYITLSETKDEIAAVARSHGWSLDGVSLFELSAMEQSDNLGKDENTLFEPSEVELHETTRMMLSKVEELRPTRVVFDSLSELRLLAQSALRYRRQILALKQYFGGRRCTVLLLDDRTSQPGDQQLQSLAHGVLSMEQFAPEYGTDRRRLRVVKLRGLKFRGGYHDFSIRTGGLDVYPRLVAAEHHAPYEASTLSSGLDGLDALLAGGLDRGTSTLISGPAGCGKSTIAAQYALASAARGEPAAIFAFDETLTTFRARSVGLGLDIDRFVRSGTLLLQQIDPAEMGPGEFAHLVRCMVEKRGTRLVVVDSLNGYLNAMPEEKFLTAQLHEVLSYLSQCGVTTLLLLAQHGLVGNMQSPVDVSYLADSVLLLRYFEAHGKIRKAISVVKKRSGGHENTIRELTIAPGGPRVGKALDAFVGVLTGAPSFKGESDDLAEVP